MLGVFTSGLLQGVSKYFALFKENFYRTYQNSSLHHNQAYFFKYMPLSQSEKNFKWDWGENVAFEIAWRPTFEKVQKKELFCFYTLRFPIMFHNIAVISSDVCYSQACICQVVKQVINDNLAPCRLFSMLQENLRYLLYWCNFGATLNQWKLNILRKLYISTIRWVMWWPTLKACISAQLVFRHSRLSFVTFISHAIAFENFETYFYFFLLLLCWFLADALSRGQ